MLNEELIKYSISPYLKDRNFMKFANRLDYLKEFERYKLLKCKEHHKKKFRYCLFEMFPEFILIESLKRGFNRKRIKLGSKSSIIKPSRKVIDFMYKYLYFVLRIDNQELIIYVDGRQIKKGLTVITLNLKNRKIEVNGSNVKSLTFCQLLIMTYFN